MVLPPDLIAGFYKEDPDCLKEVEEWLSKNGLTILFTLGEAYGDESVFLGEDKRIYIGTEKVPNKNWLKKCILKHSPELLQQAIKEKWSQRKLYEELKNISKTLSGWV